MATNIKTHIVFSHDSSIIETNVQQLPVMSARQLSMRFIHLITD